MKEKGKFSRALKIEFNYKTNKLKRANSLRPNKIIHINKFRIPMDNRDLNYWQVSLLNSQKLISCLLLS